MERPTAFPPIKWPLNRPLQGGGHVSTLLLRMLIAILFISARQRRWHKQAAGGRENPNLFTESDLEQTLYVRETLEAEASITLCEWLGNEVRVLARVLRAAQRAYWRGDDDWKKRYLAAVILILRVLQLCRELRRRAGRWFAQECLREQLRLLWGYLFGPTLPMHPIVETLLTPAPVSAFHRERTLAHLQQEQADGRAVPPPFAPLLAAWLAEEGQGRKTKRGFRDYSNR